MAQVLANGATTLPPSNPLFSPEPNLTLPKKSRKINVSNIGRKVRTYIQTSRSKCAVVHTNCFYIKVVCIVN